jgi:glycosyl transferase family 25
MNKEEQHIHNILKDIPIFWINLERSERRRNIMQTELDRYNLNHTRIEAVDGNNIDLEECNKNYTINEKMNKYEIACALSHMKAIQHCYNQGLEYALILEDDANFDYFPYKTDTLLELLGELKTINGECVQLANIIARKMFPTLNFKKNKFIKNGSVAGAQSYLITRNGMKKVLDNFENNKKIEVSESMIFGVANNFLTPPYFSYPFLRNDKGEKISISTIRENTKSAHATQTVSKMLWDEYYDRSNHI